MITVYLDWNVFNKIEKTDELDENEKTIFRGIEDLIKSKKIICPYSNAHISDLHRGYLKNPAFIGNHIRTLERLTNNLCIVQYWGAKNARWHYRNPLEFLESTIEESSLVSESFSKLMIFEDIPETIGFGELRNSLLRSIPVPESFKRIYELEPFFNSMYPKTKKEMNQLALCEDIYDFSHRIKQDYVLYKNYRKFLIQCKAKYPQVRNILIKSELITNGQPKYISWDDQWDVIDLGYKGTNQAYDKLFDLFTKTDLKGYRPDERFANLVDDALHTFYAAHCDYFITIDGRCYDKAIKVYQQLKISTKVVKPMDFHNLDFLL